jgi:apolipoprotein N-acyltransferase
VPERGLDFNARAMAVLDNHINTTLDEIDGKEDLIIWPENAIDVDPLQNLIVSQKITSLAEETGIPLLAGAILDDEELLNSTILFNEDGEPTSIYVKRYLTPFGEYIPLRSIAQIISSDADRVTDFSPGDNLVIHKVNAISIGSIICYEILNDGLVREAARKSSLLVVHTNSATFSGSAEGEQQLAITRLRAMESKKMIVSISTTGPSAIVDARGEVIKKLEDGEVGSLASVIPTQNNQTLSMRLGGFTELVVLFACAMWALFSLRKGRKK